MAWYASLCPCHFLSRHGAKDALHCASLLFAVGPPTTKRIVAHGRVINAPPSFSPPLPPRSDNERENTSSAWRSTLTFKTLPALTPCKRAVPSNDAVASCNESRENAREVMPLLWAWGRWRRHFPLLSFHTCGHRKRQGGEKGREGGKVGNREGSREGGKEGGRKGGRKDDSCRPPCLF